MGHARKETEDLLASLFFAVMGAGSGFSMPSPDRVGFGVSWSFAHGGKLANTLECKVITHNQQNRLERRTQHTNRGARVKQSKQTLGNLSDARCKGDDCLAREQQKVDAGVLFSRCACFEE